MKVYGLITNGKDRDIVAAKNQKEAAIALGVSLHHFRIYASQTWNNCEIEVAMGKPGRVFREVYPFSRDYEELAQ